MAVDFEAVKKLPVDEQVGEFKKIITAANIFINDTKKKLAELEKTEAGEERDKKIAESKKLLDDATKDRNSAEQLLARSELDAKALETVLAQTRAERKADEQEKGQPRDQLEHILAQERTRDEERKRDEKRPEDAYKPSKGYETSSVYEQQNKFYDNTNPNKPRDENQPYKSRADQAREQEVLRSMYAGSHQDYQ